MVGGGGMRANTETSRSSARARAATTMSTRGEATVVSPLEGEGEDSNPSLQGSGEYERPPLYYYSGPK